MKICALSDIHGTITYMEKVGSILSSVDIVVITGDFFGKQATIRESLSHIEQFNSSIIAVHGNWDGSEEQNFLAEKGYSVHASGVIIDRYGFFGAGGSNVTPLNTPAEYSDQKLKAYLDQGFKSIEKTQVKIMLTHTPPRNTRDRTNLLTRAGSVAVRQFLLEHHVDVNICGHIHEAYGIDKLDKTIVVNPGSFANGRYALITLNDKISVKLGVL